MTFFAIRFLNADNQKRNSAIEEMPFKVGFTVLATTREETDFILSPVLDVPATEAQLVEYLDSKLGKGNYKLVSIRKMLDSETTV
ncbi:MAG: hypothetical protein HY512_00465 [Candidatus Aenigmarchaeota archaeon]|nr:hypothetical protein [Candidatus Aenigmarchaeota archaeon]